MFEKCCILSLSEMCHALETLGSPAKNTCLTLPSQIFFDHRILYFWEHLLCGTHDEKRWCGLSSVLIWVCHLSYLCEAPCPSPLAGRPDFPVLVGAPEAGAVSSGSFSRGDRSGEGSWCGAGQSGPEKLGSTAREVDQKSYPGREAGGGEAQPIWSMDEEVEPAGVKAGSP